MLSTAASSQLPRIDLVWWFSLVPRLISSTRNNLGRGPLAVQVEMPLKQYPTKGGHYVKELHTDHSLGDI